jgi:hypothetical protein
MQKSKIQIIRDEFTRIGCDQSSWERPFSVSWHFRDISVRGMKLIMIDYEALCVLLKKLPDNVGEAAFWSLLDKTDLEALYKKLDEENLENLKKL